MSGTAPPVALPSAIASLLPAATPTPVPTAAPTVSAPSTPNAPAMVPYDPPAGTYPFFPSSIFVQRIPSNPNPNPSSAAWIAKLGAKLSGFNFAANSAGLSRDYTYPIYPMNPLASTAVPVKVHCNEPWGTCNVEGQTVYIDKRELPEDGGTSGEDSHLSLIDAAGGKEYDFWTAQWPPSNGVLTIGWGGSCSLGGNGYDGCVATASGTPLSVGIVRVSDLFNAMGSPTGSLPYALQVGVACTNGKVAPVTGSNGNTAGCPPEGARAYLALHDSDIDASNEPNLAKAILRTIDEDHYGMVVTDTSGNGDGSGFAMQLESDLTYTAFGQAGPLVSRLAPEAQAEGIRGATPYNNYYYIQTPYDGVDLKDNLKFL